MKKNKGMLIVLSGPSGAGKDTILGKLLEKRDDVNLSISYTTRTPRLGEVDGKDYHFVDKEVFQKAIDDGEMLEYACYCGNYYGTPRFEVEKSLESGKSVILEIEVQGAEQIIKKCPDAVSIFIVPPSIEELKKRLKNRASDSEEAVIKRVSEAEKEISLAGHYRYIVVNDDVKLCTDNVSKIIDSEYMKSSRMGYIIKEVLEK